MAKGFKHGAGGVGASLNFKVVGNPQPENPKENTIWVNTDAKITSWIFSATEPQNPSEGMVWFATGAIAGVEFDALKKNSIKVYPRFTAQYIDGAWVDVSAKIYKNDEWVGLWSGELFWNGNQYEDITGGWVTTGWVYVSGDPSVAGTHSMDQKMELSAPKSSCHALRTQNKIDLTNYSKIFVSSECGGSSDNGVIISTATSGVVNPKTLPLKNGDYEIDISGYNGLYYVGILVRHNGWASISEIRLVR